LKIIESPAMRQVLVPTGVLMFWPGNIRPPMAAFRDGRRGCQIGRPSLGKIFHRLFNASPGKLERFIANE
jgi:hypothetical protein